MSEKYSNYEQLFRSEFQSEFSIKECLKAHAVIEYCTLLVIFYFILDNISH